MRFLLPWFALLLALAPTCDVHAVILVDDDVMACERPEFRQQLLQGDFSAIHEAFDAGSSRCLWHFYLQALNNAYGKGRNDKLEAELRKRVPEEQRLELNRHISQTALT
jgi:hypothetical protein